MEPREWTVNTSHMEMIIAISVKVLMGSLGQEKVEWEGVEWEEVEWEEEVETEEEVIEDMEEEDRGVETETDQEKGLGSDGCLSCIGILLGKSNKGEIGF